MPGIDFETYSEAGYVWSDAHGKYITLPNCSKYGLEVVGAHIYAAHPSTEPLSLQYATEGEPDLWLPGMPAPHTLFEYVRDGGVLGAWNSMFEFLIWNWICVPRFGWPLLPLEQLSCTMARARAFGLPGKLEKAAEVMGGVQKQAALGKQLIRRYSIPKNPSGRDPRRRIRPEEDGVRAAQLYDYGLDDVRAESSIAERIPELSAEEREVWLLDQRINLRGVPIDRPTIRKAQAVLAHMEKIHNAELQRLTYGEVNAYSEVAATQKWLYDRWNIATSSLDEDAIDALLAERKDIHPEPKRVLEIRRTMASAGVKKVYSMDRQAGADDRIRGLYIYHSAHTGRFAAGGFQPHNMKSGGPSLSHCNACQNYYTPTDMDCCRWCGSSDTTLGHEWNGDIMEACINFWSRATPEETHRMYGPWTMGLLASSVRGMIHAAPGHEFICSDYSAIEGVGLAMLAGEQWRIDVFRTHGKIYEMSASKITGMPLEEMLEYRKRTGQHHPDRKKGKTGELASGYQGWLGAWKQFGADQFMSDEEIKQAILAWRAASPAIVELWGGQWRKHPTRWEFTYELYGLEGMAIAAVQKPGEWFTYRYISFICWNDVLYMRLPSGRCIAYHRPRLSEGVDRYSGNTIHQLSYEAWNTNPKKGPVGWIRTQTYGGELTNNANQGTCRDIFAYGMRNVEAGGYPIVLHTHDEIISEVPVGFGQVEHFEQLMMTLPAWCSDWPIRASGGWRGKRYRKE